MIKAILHEPDSKTTFNVEVVDTFYDPETHIKYATVKPLDFKMFNREVPYENLEILEESKDNKVEKNITIEFSARFSGTEEQYNDLKRIVDHHLEYLINLDEFKEIKEAFGGELKENYDYTKIEEKPKSKSR